MMLSNKKMYILHNNVAQVNADSLIFIEEMFHLLFAYSSQFLVLLLRMYFQACSKHVYKHREIHPPPECSSKGHLLRP